MAEFLRLSLIANLIRPSTVTAWADSIVAVDQSPNIAFIELSIAESQPTSAILTLLASIPGQITPELPVRMLLGHSARLIEAHDYSTEQVLLSLYKLSRIEHFPEKVYLELVCLEDDYSLVRYGVHGTLREIENDFITLLSGYKPYTPTILAENA